MSRGLYLTIIAGIAAAAVAVLAGCPTGKPVRECNPTDDTPCFADFACDPTTRTCLRACTSEDDCVASQTCDLTDPDKGMCRGSTPTPDGAGGDSSSGD